MLFSKAIAVLSLLAAAGAATQDGHIRSRQLTECAKLEVCKIFDKVSRVTTPLETGTPFEYESGRGDDYVLVCTTTGNNGVTEDESLYLEGTWINIMAIYDGEAPSILDIDGAIKVDYTTNLKGEWKFQRLLMECVNEKKISVGGYLEDGDRCDAKMYTFKCPGGPPPPPTPTPPTPTPPTPTPPTHCIRCPDTLKPKRGVDCVVDIEEDCVCRGELVPIPGEDKCECPEGTVPNPDRRNFCISQPPPTPAPTPGDNCPFPAGGNLVQGPCKFGEFALYETKYILEGKCKINDPDKCEDAQKVAELASKYPGKYSCDCDVKPPECPPNEEDIKEPQLCSGGEKYGVFETSKVLDGECTLKCEDYEKVIQGFNEGKFQCDCTPPPPGADPCGVCDKPKLLQFKLLAENCVDFSCNSQDKSKVTGTVVGSPVSWSSEGQSGSVANGEVFTISGDFGSNIIINLNGMSQIIDFHTSCSSAIVPGDKFGRLQLVGYNDGTGCGFVEDDLCDIFPSKFCP